ncbi:MAG: type I-U CRISPR-associated protein Cas7 [Gemmataceae bacterium]|nr:type I-U CRISPR-associated protein Cas7 [Gemmataceae bacterium]
MSDLTKYDHYLTHDGPAALVIREPLMPVEGTDGVLFPATFASGDGFPGGYNIDVFPEDKDVGPGLAARIKDGKLKPTAELFPHSKNVALIDSVGAQANRIEPLFKEESYKHLVPQIAVTAGNKEVSILDASHRAGDALVRCSSLQSELQAAFKAVQNGDASLLAKIAPTSLVFGVWDSRDTQAKLPRVVASTIRAFDVRKLTRSAQFNPPVDYAALEVFSEEDKAKAEGDSKNPLAKRGFVHVPATGSHGGVIADGGVVRNATLGLAALRLLHAGKNEANTLTLRRYILGLSLVAFTHSPTGYLRQGCLLVLNPEIPREFVEVYPNGDRKPCGITAEQALKFATEAAKAFGVGDNKTVPFDAVRAKNDVKAEAGAKQPKKGKGKGNATEVATQPTEVRE